MYQRLPTYYTQYTYKFITDWNNRENDSVSNSKTIIYTYNSVTIIGKC